MQTVITPTLEDENDSPIPHGTGIALAMLFMCTVWLATYLLI